MDSGRKMPGCKGEQALPASGYIKTATIRFYAELNDFLKKKQRQKSFSFSFKGLITVKEAIESLGVPHSAVDLVLVNSRPSGFGTHVGHGDYISVYPEFESFDISGLALNDRKPLRTTRFVLDAHLGKLARYLRLLGFDSFYEKDISDEVIIARAQAEKRIILTRDKGILRSDRVDHGYYLRSIRPKEQLREVIDKFDLQSQFKPFTLCLVCNGELEKTDPALIMDQINADTARFYTDFYKCSGCERIFWEGSHYHRMKKFIDELK